MLIEAPLLLAGASALVVLLVVAVVGWILAARRAGRAQAQAALLRAEIKNQQMLDRERAAALELAGERLASAFGNIADRSLQVNSEHFLKLARENLGQHQIRAQAELGEREKAIEQLVRPIVQALEKTERQIAEIEKQRHEAYGSIRTQLEGMHATQQALHVETRQLVTALRRPEVRGQWGEITLRRLVELAGMVEHCDFVEQVHRATETGALRPDMVVRMPDNRELVVDVKTPLDAYLAAAEASDDETRRSELERHARNVRTHIKVLAGRQYWAQFEHSPEFVILFIPGEQFLAAALDADPGLFEEAVRSKVILATPASLVALLKAVAYGWRQLALADNADRIRDLAEDLYKRLNTFTEYLSQLGRNLKASVSAYNRAVGSLERQVLPGARKFVDLGIQSSRDLEELESIEKSVREVHRDDDPPGS